MVLNIRRVGEVADGSVTAEKLAVDAVDLSTDKVTGELPGEKLADAAVIESKLASLAISTDKLQNNVVTLAKANNDIRLTTFTGDETEVSVSGTVEEAVKGLSFPKRLGHFYPTDMRFLATLKTSTAGIPATANLYINGDPSPRATFSSTATTYEVKSAEFDISDLGSGSHYLEMKLVSSGIADIAYNDMIDVMLIK